MPCPWSRRCHAANVIDNTMPALNLAGMEDWKQIRWRNLRMMRKQTRTVVILMALMEAMRVGPVQMVYAGRKGYPAPAEEDFGIAYTAGYVFSYLYVCLFAIIFVPFFSWWVPTSKASDPNNPSVFHRIADYLKKFNMILLPLTIGLCLAQHVYYTIQALLYVETTSIERPQISTTRKSWLLRLIMLCTVAISLSFGYGAFQILAQLDLAHVKQIEYLVIVVPAQVNVGILMGSVVQYKMEKKIAARAAREALRNQEEAVVGEKEALLDV